MNVKRTASVDLDKASSTSSDSFDWVSFVERARVTASPGISDEFDAPAGSMAANLRFVGLADDTDETRWTVS